MRIHVAGAVATTVAATTLAGLGALPAGAAVPADPGAVTTQTKTLFSDDFRSGFDTSAAGRWAVAVPGNDDAIPSTSSRGLKIIPKGINPATRAPAFSLTFPQATGDTAGWLDHVKFMDSPRHTATNGTLGYDIPANGSLSCTSDMAVTVTGVDKHPFGKNVTDAQSDLRLAAGASNSNNLDTGLVFDWMITNGTVYAYYERLQVPGTDAAVFSYAVPVAKRTPGEKDTYQVTIDQHRSRATWTLNGRKVLSVDKIGARALDRQFMIIDGGGTDNVVAPAQLNCGVAAFTLLDGAGANGRGLVRLDGHPNTYFAPRLGAPVAQTFLDDKALAKNRLFGQGVQLNVSRFEVSSTS
jgi:hypothetical protein